MKKNFYIGMALIVILIASLLSYGVYLNRRSENQITERMNERLLPLQGTKVKFREISPVMEVDLIDLYSKEMIDVTTLISGRLNKIFAEQHTFVNAGDPIVELINEEIPLQIKQAESDILDAEVQLERAQNTFNRYSELLDSDAISREKFEEAQTALKSAKARLENYIAKRDQFLIQQSRQKVTAPISGEILRLYRQQGAYISEGSPIALIGNFDLLYFDSELKNDFNGKISVGDTVHVKFADNENFLKYYGSRYASGNKGNEQIFDARLVEIYPPISEPTAVRQLIWEIDNKVALLEPGFYGGVKIYPNFQKKCLTIPLNATVDGEKNLVFVVEDGILKRREIITGISDEKYLEIINGLNEGDIVITSNTEGLAEDLKVEVTLDEEES